MKEILEKLKARELVLKYLIANGYPPESLATELESERCNITIIDPKTTELIAIIEICFPNKLIVSSKPVRESIKKFLGVKNKKNVQFFLITVLNGTLSFTQLISNLNNFEKAEFIPLEKMPNFEDIRKKTLGRNRKDVQEKIEIICWISAVVIGAIVFLDFIGYLKTTFEQLSLLGLIIALILIPFASKIRIFNIEFERKEKSK